MKQLGHLYTHVEMWKDLVALETVTLPSEVGGGHTLCPRKVNPENIPVYTDAREYMLQNTG